MPSGIGVGAERPRNGVGCWAHPEENGRTIVLQHGVGFVVFLNRCSAVATLVTSRSAANSVVDTAGEGHIG